MIINKEVISKLDPCKDRFKNFIKFYGNKDFSIKQFMGLKNITHKDKLWVAFRLLPKDKIALVAADIAELVLNIYERQYPNDLRPRKAIEAARSGGAGCDSVANSYYAANSAYAAYAAYADNAANVAYASYVAYVASIANVANVASYAYSVAFFAASAASNKNAMEKKQRTILIRYLLTQLP
jgi:hypothetical protein